MADIVTASEVQAAYDPFTGNVLVYVSGKVVLTLTLNAAETLGLELKHSAQTGRMRAQCWHLIRRW